MSDKIHFSRRVCGPQVDGKDVERCVDLININFLSRHGILHDQSNAWRGGNWTTIFISESTHSCPYRLLVHLETVYPPVHPT